MHFWIFVFINLVGCCTSTDCPDGWLAFEGSCYLFGADAVSHTEAEHFCRQHNSHLVHVESSEENNFLKGFISTYLQVNHDYWLGMTDDVAEGLWVWPDHSRMEFNDWGPTEPQNYQNEDCAVLAHGIQFKWADVQCTTHRNPLCELSEGLPNVVG